MIRISLSFTSSTAGVHRDRVCSKRRGWIKFDLDDKRKGEIGSVEAEDKRGLKTKAVDGINSRREEGVVIFSKVNDRKVDMTGVSNSRG